MKCINCKYWNNKQAELEYSIFYGICTNSNLKFSTEEGKDCVVLDRENKSKKHMGVQRFENQSSIVPFGAVEHSRYCFVTEESFGCVNFESVKSKK